MGMGGMTKADMLSTCLEGGGVGVVLGGLVVGVSAGRVVSMDMVIDW